jgi:hypothetical protein
MVVPKLISYFMPNHTILESSPCLRTSPIVSNSKHERRCSYSRPFFVLISWREDSRVLDPSLAVDSVIRRAGPNRGGAEDLILNCRIQDPLDIPRVTSPSKDLLKLTLPHVAIPAREETAPRFTPTGLIAGLRASCKNGNTAF